MKWEEWYRERRDTITENMGKITAFTVRQSRPEWDTYILQQIRDVLDAMNVIYHDTEKLFEQNNEIIKRLEKRDSDITDVLSKIQDWMKKYQPILDTMDDEYDILGKVKEHG
jgi:predicted nucleic acid-binding protein